MYNIHLKCEKGRIILVPVSDFEKYIPLELRINGVDPEVIGQVRERLKASLGYYCDQYCGNGCWLEGSRTVWGQIKQGFRTAQMREFLVGGLVEGRGFETWEQRKSNWKK